ncbi:MAG: SurA N-terminal domain-containing protein [Gammaproteobacteria bacterium]|nr:SurA N-terminal domain-containing protein [Gammaproteobacteria bacterium]
MSIKNFSKGSIAVYVTACLAILFIFSLVFSPSLQTNIRSSKQVGKVGGVAINEKDFYLAYQGVKNKIFSSNISLPVQELNAFILNETWSYLHTRYSIQAMMVDDGYVAPKLMIEKEIINDPYFQVDGLYSPKKFKSFLKQREMNVDHLIEIKGVDMMQNALFSIVQDISQPIQSELDQLKSVASVQKKISVKTIEVNKQSISQPTDVELKNYYNAHQIDFVKPNQYKFKYAIIDDKLFRQSKSPSTNELKTFFNKNLENYIIPEQVLVDVRSLKPKKGAGLTSSETNFIQSMIGINQMLDGVIDDLLVNGGKGYELVTQKPIWRPVAQLPKDLVTNEFIKQKQPIINKEADGTIVIVQNKSYKSELVPKFEMVISTVTDDFKRHSANEQFQLHLDDLMDRAYSGALSWDQLQSMMPNLKTMKTNLLDLKEMQSSMPFNSFSKLNAWIETNIDSKEILIKSLSNNKVVVIQQIDYLPKHVQSFKSVKLTIQQLLNKEAKLKKSETIANQVLKEVELKTDYKTLGKSWKYFPKVTYAYNDLGYPGLVWVATLQRSGQDSVILIGDLARDQGQFYIVKWWDDQSGPVNDVFYHQLASDWGITFASESIERLVNHYSLKKYINA